LGIRFAVRREKKTRFIGFALIATGDRRAVMQKQMPITLLIQGSGVGALLKFAHIGNIARAARCRVSDETQHQPRETNQRRK